MLLISAFPYNRRFKIPCVDKRIWCAFPSNAIWYVCFGFLSSDPHPTPFFVGQPNALYQDWVLLACLSRQPDNQSVLHTFAEGAEQPFPLVAIQPSPQANLVFLQSSASSGAFVSEGMAQLYNLVDIAQHPPNSTDLATDPDSETVWTYLIRGKSTH